MRVANWKNRLLHLGILTALSLPALAQDYEFYAVKPTDTLEKLATLQRVSCDTILQLNPALKNAQLPPPGTVIFLPTPPPMPHRAARKASHREEKATASASSKEEGGRVEQVRAGSGGELSDDEVDALYENTVKPLGGRIAEVASAGAAALPEHQNTVTTSDGHVIMVPEARSKPRVRRTVTEPVKDTSHVRRSLSSRRGMQAQSLLRNALRFMGVPYVWGGVSPSGFDCSGFVQHVYASCGISLPRTADLQFNIGRAVTAGKEQPGDLIFFETYCPGPSHIGIFLGRHQFVHASSAAGHITISDLREGHFQRCYLGAKRVF